MLIIINIAALLIFLLLTFILYKKSTLDLTCIDKKEHKLYFLYPFADWLLIKTGMGKILDKKADIKKSVNALYPSEKPEQIQRLFWCGRISAVFLILFLFDVIALVSYVNSFNDSVLLNGKYLMRPDSGEGSTRVQLGVTMEQPTSEDDNRNENKYQEVVIDVEEKAYTSKEIEDVFEKAFSYLEKEVLGTNQSRDAIDSKLSFCSGVPGTGITVDWDPIDTELIQSDGTINNEGIKQEGIDTVVTVTLTYHNIQSKKNMNFKVMPKRYSEEEILGDRLNEELDKASDETAGEMFLELPDTLDDYHLSWSDKEKNHTANIMLLGIMIAIVVWLTGRKELEKKMRLRAEEMLIDYPEIINKFTLLVNAGMTIKQAWYKIAEDYCIKSEQKSGKKRYAYEEMLTTVNELKLGMPEHMAYEQYGRRTGLISYIKFSSLIAQNLKKGNRGFTQLLINEARQAFEERKEIAKRRGEEAGTKLLIPMMAMLIMVFMIIMIPALWSMQV